MRRIASAATAVLVLAIPALVLSAPASAAPTSTQPTPSAAGWLARQLVDGERFEVVFGEDTFPDQGLTADTILAFAAARASGTNAQKAIDWLDDPVVADGYYGSFDADPATATAGSVAKLILAAQVMGKDPASFAGGVDLVALLLTLQNPTTGRFADTGPFGDFANVLGQSFATIALARTADHDDEAELAADYLAAIQCDGGGWPQSLAGTTTLPDCDAEVDSTAMAVQALLAAGRADDAADGLDWLESKQKPNGGFDDDAQFGVNANSTGLAAQALRAGGRTGPADEAVDYLLTLQVGCGGPAEQLGAIAYDVNGFDAANVNRATAQGILGLAGIGFAELTIDGADADAPALACATTPPATSASGGLAATGASLTGLLTAGAALVVAGAVLLLIARARRRRADV